MKIAIFGKKYSPEDKTYLEKLILNLKDIKSQLCIYKPYYDLLPKDINFPSDINFFTNHEDLSCSILISIGGDGTILDTIPFVRDSGIPILGINLGRLGFLSSIAKDEIETAIHSIAKGDYSVEKRALLKLEKPSNFFGEVDYALNDITLYRNNTTSLVVVHVYIDDVFLNSYWGDGLIISTPTGSTAYSLSVGGPIITPGSQNFLIAPIASHNLTVRPVVIQDSSRIRIKIEGREDKYLITLDSKQSSINKEEELIIRRNDFDVNLIQMNNKNFFSTIRDKLMWGFDNRN
ncbi:MAG: NAD kinase [Marinilabiliales bacterium]|nr:MAG: NAD kinase [Marinilabiliales bacterium]